MTCLILADDEFSAQQLPTGPVDLVISCGDLSDSFILQVAERCSCQMIFAVRGNHDTAAPFPAPIIDLHLCSHEFGGLRFGGFAGCQRYKLRGHHLYEQAEVEHALRGFPTVDVFVAHNSPWGIHDDTRGDEAHQGFQAFGGYIARQRPRFFLHGHQHLNRQSLLDDCEVVGVYGHRLLDLSTPSPNT